MHIVVANVVIRSVVDMCALLLCGVVSNDATCCH